MTSAIRQKRILEALCEGRFAAHVLAERLGACVRTIYRDIRALQDAGYAIGAASGRCGGFWLLPSSKPAPVHLSAASLRKLLLLAASSSAGAELLGPLIRGLPPAEAIAARRVLERLEVDRPESDFTTLCDDLLEPVWSALASRRSVLIDGALLSPRQLVLSREGPVLVGWDSRHVEQRHALNEVRGAKRHPRRGHPRLGSMVTFDARWASAERKLRYLTEPSA